MSGNPAPPILLTRAALQAEAYEADLVARFGDRAQVIVAPLLRIVEVPGAVDLQGIHTLLFTSVNGVEAFATRSDRRDIPALCVGEKSAQAARDIGLAGEAAAGTAEDLFDLALKRGKGRAGGFLYLRGRHTSRDLTARLTTAGHAAREQVVYDQQAVALSPAALAALKAGPVIVPLFSPRTARLFAAEVAGMDLSASIALCISERVAAEVASLGFGHVIVTPEPTSDAVTREIAARI
jgi:uroporphyrinogen-III synthase